MVAEATVAADHPGAPVAAEVMAAVAAAEVAGKVKLIKLLENEEII